MGVNGVLIDVGCLNLKVREMDVSIVERVRTTSRAGLRYELRDQSLVGRPWTWVSSWSTCWVKEITNWE